MIVNKADMASEDEIDTTTAVCRALNENAIVSRASFGSVSLETLLPGVTLPTEVKVADCCAKGTCASSKAKDAAKKLEEEKKSDCCSNSDCSEHTHSAHDHDLASVEAEAPPCTA